MTDAGDALALLRCCRRHERAGCRKKDTLELPVLKLRQQIAGKNRGAASTAGAAGMHILFCPVVKQHPAIAQNRLKVKAVYQRKLLKKGILYD